MTRRAFKATATREDGWWVVEVDGVGATEGRTAAEARSMAVDLVEVMLDVTAPKVDVEFGQVRT